MDVAQVARPVAHCQPLPLMHPPTARLDSSQHGLHHLPRAEVCLPLPLLKWVVSIVICPHLWHASAGRGPEGSVVLLVRYWWVLLPAHPTRLVGGWVGAVLVGAPAGPPNWVSSSLPQRLPPSGALSPCGFPTMGPGHPDDTRGSRAP